MLPHEIEEKSFEIIDYEAGPHGRSPEEWSIVRRMIHSTADFEYVYGAAVHPGAIEAGVRAITGGKAIVTDTHMAKSGIRKQVLEQYGCPVHCFMMDPGVAAMAKDSGTTRAAASMDKAAPLLDGGVAVIGNAPTALLRLLELIEGGRANPALVVGLPVGFVNAAESKALLEKAAVSFIANRGRKGGSNVAAAVMNALSIIVEKRNAT